MQTSGRRRSSVLPSDIRVLRVHIAYLALSSGSYDSRSYHAFGSRVSISRPRQDTGRDKVKALAQAYVMHISDHHDTITSIIVDIILLIFSSWAHVLFDTSTSHSFISMMFGSMLGLEYESLKSTLSVGVSLGRDCELSFQCSLVRIEIDGRRVLADQIIMPMKRFDVMIGID